MSAVREREHRRRRAGIEVVRLGGNIGAEIEGVDLRRPLCPTRSSRSSTTPSCTTR